MSPESTSDATIGVSEFKRRCLELLEKMRHEGNELVITKRGVPIARVTPLRATARPLRGSMRDLIKVRGEIVECDWTDDWDAAK